MHIPATGVITFRHTKVMRCGDSLYACRYIASADCAQCFSQCRMSRGEPACLLPSSQYRPHPAQETGCFSVYMRGCSVCLSRASMSTDLVRDAPCMMNSTAVTESAAACAGQQNGSMLLGCHGPCVTCVCCAAQESLGGYGEEGSFPATASTAAAQQALTQSRQRRDERALDKGPLRLPASGALFYPACTSHLSPGAGFEASRMCRGHL